MKNKLKLVLVGILSLVLVTGCGMKTNIHMDIKANKDVNVSMTLAMDDELIDNMIGYGDQTKAGNITDKDRWAYVDEAFSDSEDMKDWKQEKYDENGFKGYTLTSKTLNLDDLTGTDSNAKYDFFGEENLDNAKLFIKTSKGYKSNFTGDMKNDDSLGASTSYASQMSLFEVTFSVTLPNKPSSHNATSVSKDGKTLTWDLTKEPNIEFEFNTGANYMLYASIIVLIVVVVAVVIILTVKPKKKNDEPTITPVQEDNKAVSNENPVEQTPVEPKESEPTVETNTEPVLNNEVVPEPKEEPSLQEMYNEPSTGVGAEPVAEPKTEASLQDMYNTDASNGDNQNVNN